VSCFSVQLSREWQVVAQLESLVVAWHDELRQGAGTCHERIARVRCADDDNLDSEDSDDVADDDSEASADVQPSSDDEEDECLPPSEV
jgi:hypothetical protein